MVTQLRGETVSKISTSLDPVGDPREPINIRPFFPKAIPLYQPAEFLLPEALDSATTQKQRLSSKCPSHKTFTHHSIRVAQKEKKLFGVFFFCSVFLFCFVSWDSEGSIREYTSGLNS